MLTRLTLLLSVLCFTSAASAQSPAEARRWLESQHDRVEQVLRQPAGSARDTRLESILQELLDFDALTRDTLGDEWAQRTPEQRAEYGRILKALVEGSYTGNLERTQAYRVTYESPRAAGDDVVVKTVAQNRENRREPPVEIEYTLRHGDEGWRVVNLRVNNATSMVDNYRRQVSRTVRREGWDALISQMQARLDEA